MTLPTETSGVKKILEKHGARLQVHGKRGISHKEMFEELIGELEDEHHRGAVVQANLNAILNQYQVTSASLKALQASYDQLLSKAHRQLSEANEETDTNGK